MSIFGWFHCKKQDVPVREGFWSNPVFDDEDVYKLYKKYLLRAGHCPLCEDYCFIDIEKATIGYTVVKRCISTDCDYKEDISYEFNKDLGIKTIIDNDARLDFVNRFKDTVKDNFQQEKKNHQRIGVPNVSYHYYNINQHIQENVPKSTGTLKKSFLYTGFTDDKRFYRQLDSMDLMLEVCDELPIASKDNSRAIYLVPSPNIDDVLEEYVVVEDFDGNYSWLKIGEEFKNKIFKYADNDGILEIARAWDCRTRQYVYTSNVYKNDFLNEISRNAKGYKQ